MLPNNPTGAVYTKEQLKLWVDWALNRRAVILFVALMTLFRTLNCPQAFIKYPVPETVPLSFALFPAGRFTGYDAVTMCLIA